MPAFCMTFRNFVVAQSGGYCIQNLRAGKGARGNPQPMKEGPFRTKRILHHKATFHNITPNIQNPHQSPKVWNTDCALLKRSGSGVGWGRDG